VFKKLIGLWSIVVEPPRTTQAPQKTPNFFNQLVLFCHGGDLTSPPPQQPYGCSGLSFYRDLGQSRFSLSRAHLSCACFFLCSVLGTSLLPRRGQEASSRANANTSEGGRAIRLPNVSMSQRIPYTDFPLTEYELFCIDRVVLLKSEY
jgi:hypothetical protein